MEKNRRRWSQSEFCRQGGWMWLALATLLWPNVGEAKVITHLRDNLVITESVKFRPGRYKIEDRDGNGVIQVAADNITVDLRGIELWGGDPRGDRSNYTGFGIHIKGRKNVRILGGKIHGYYCNIRVDQSSKIHLEGIDAGHSRAQRIFKDGEVVVTWLSLRNLGAWRKYGAGIWVESSHQVTVEKCRGQGAQNGVLLVHSRDSLVRKCDFSFNSGWGIGLWKSSHNRVLWNTLEFVGRPCHSHFGIGSDAAALVVVNGSCHNWIVGNSMTHGGDGFFLTNLNDYGGGHYKGGSEDNIIALNDGSYSPHNAFEGTFSRRNYYVRNLANHSNYGFWLGFSSDNVLIENQVHRSFKTGIAIECATGGIIAGNHLTYNREGSISLWTQDSRKDRFPTKNYLLQGNTVSHSAWGIWVKNASGIEVVNNRMTHANNAKSGRGKSGLAYSKEKFWNSEMGRKILAYQKKLKENITFYSHNSHLPKGFMWYRFDDWAPHDFRRDRAFFARDKQGHLHLWLPRPGWKPLSRQSGFSLEKTSSPRHFLVKDRIKPGGIGETARRSLQMKHRSGKVAKIPFYHRSMSWKIHYYKLSSFDIKNHREWKKLFDGRPDKVVYQSRLGPHWDGRRPPVHRWALAAKTRFRFAPGKYRFTTISDDGIQVYVGEKLVIDNWTVHSSQRNQATLDLQGEREVLVLYFQNGGGAALDVNWHRVGR